MHRVAGIEEKFKDTTVLSFERLIQGFFLVLMFGVTKLALSVLAAFDFENLARMRQRRGCWYMNEDAGVSDTRGGSERIRMR